MPGCEGAVRVGERLTLTLTLTHTASLFCVHGEEVKVADAHDEKVEAVPIVRPIDLELAVRDDLDDDLEREDAKQGVADGLGPWNDVSIRLDADLQGCVDSKSESG